MAPNIPSPAYPYGPGGPSISGRDFTVDWALKDPTFIRKSLTEVTARQLLTGYLFTETPAPSGSLIYDRVADQDLYVSVDPNLQPGEIEPGQEFPLVAVDEPAPVPATTVHIGGRFDVTYRQVRRDRRDVISRGLTKLRNTLLKGSALRALTAILTDPDIPTDVWTGTKLDNTGFDGTGFAAFVSKQIAKVNNDDLGYHVTDIVINPDTASGIVGAEKIQSRLPRENKDLNPILNGQLNGLLGVNWITRRSCPAGTMIFTQQKVVGTVGVELPLYSRQVDVPQNEKWVVMAAYMDVPVITDPYSTRIVTGLVT